MHAGIVRGREEEDGPRAGLVAAVVKQLEGDGAARQAGIEEMLLSSLERLYHEIPEHDVRLGLLRVTLQLLQRHGAPPSLSSLCIARTGPALAGRCHEMQCTLLVVDYWLHVDPNARGASLVGMY